MPAARAAASRLIPSRALASASRRLLTRPSRSRRAIARRSAAVRPVAIATATMAQAPGLLSLPGQPAGRRPRSRLPVAGIMRNLTSGSFLLTGSVIPALGTLDRWPSPAGPPLASQLSLARSSGQHFVSPVSDALGSVIRLAGSHHPVQLVSNRDRAKYLSIKYIYLYIISTYDL